MSEPKTDWTNVSAKSFVRLMPHDKKRWLEAVNDVGHFDAAIMVCISYDDANARKMVEEAKDRFILKQEGVQADRHHGEERMAAAVANQLGRQGVRWGKWGVWLAIGSILLTLTIAILQQCRG